MHILALETTGKYASAAVVDESGIIVEASSQAEMNHLKEIISLADECMNKAGIGKSEITHVAASVGPGSFTGIRIGVTTARAMGQMLGIPCVQVPTLDAMVSSAHSRESRYVCAIINARRRQTYAKLCEIDCDGRSRVILPGRQYMIEEVCECIKKLDGKVMFTGDGIDAYEKIITDMLEDGTYEFQPVESRYQSAKSVAQIAWARAKCGMTVSYNELMPEYMRKSEAEMRLEEGTLSKKIHG